MQDEVQNIRDQGLSEEDTRTEIASLVDELYGKDVEDLTAILSPDQMKRVKQLMLQQQGASAIARKEVAEAIGLAEDTRVTLKKKIDEMNAASREKMRELFQGGDRDEIRKVMNENRKALEEAVLATLSDAQKAKFTEMKGAEFKFPEPQAGGNRRRDF
jgi:mevalonate kinase